MTADKFHDALTLLPSDLIAEADAMRQSRPKVLRLRRYAAMAASLAVVLLCGALLTGPLKPKYKAATEMAAPEAADMAQSQLAEAPAEAAPKWEPETGMEETQAAVTGNSTVKSEPAAAEPSSTEQEICSLPTAPLYEESLPRDDLGNTNRFSTPFAPNSSVNIYSVPQNLVLSTPAELETYIENHSNIYDFTELEAALPTYDEVWFANNDLLITLVHSTSTDFTWTVTGIRDVRGIDEKGWDWFIIISATEEPTPDPYETDYHLLTPVEKGRIDPNSSILNVYDNPNTEGP